MRRRQNAILLPKKPSPSLHGCSQALGREHGLLPDIHVEEKRGVRQDRRQPIESAERLVGLAGPEAARGRSVEPAAGAPAEGRRHERPHALPADGGSLIAAEALRGIGGWGQ